MIFDNVNGCFLAKPAFLGISILAFELREEGAGSD